MGLRITIDGPAGAGKSAVARTLAQRLNVTYLDTGAMYRALALKSLWRSIAADDAASLVTLLASTAIDLESGRVFLDGEDVTESIRLPEVDERVSAVARHPEVRQRMVAMQRRLASERDIVMDGRDTGTDVLPNAELKVFLTASLDERARRRAAELRLRGVGTDETDVKGALAARDASDIDRAVGALRTPPGALVIDSTGLTLEQVVDRILIALGERS